MNLGIVSDEISKDFEAALRVCKDLGIRRVEVRNLAAGRAPMCGEAAMAERTVERLAAAGYERYEISSFARPGFAARHNTSYWDGSDYLGLGAGAHSFSAEPAPGRRWANERRPERYLAAMRERGTAVATEERLSPAQARGEFCFTGLRQAAGVDLVRFRRRFGVALRTAFPHVERLIADGLVEASGDRVRLTARGFRYADTVAASFV